MYEISSNEIIVISYANVNITGTERSKPQIRVFLHDKKIPLDYAKRNNYRFFLFTIFTQDLSMATGLTAFDPRNYIVSLETNLDNETSRRDLRSLYDYVQNNVAASADFLRCPKEKHNAGIVQAAFINIGTIQSPKKDIFENYIKYFDNRPYMSSVDYSSSREENRDNKKSQIIYYGVPGCGKSHAIQKQLKSVAEYNKIRTVFHPEYTNADFIGQILPEVHINAENKSVVEYKFNPGPFTEIIRRAYLNPDEKFYLVIEEINRGNAAAIFGDAFQLLDRIKSGEDSSTGNSYKKDWSKYGVDNVDVNAYIRKIDLLKEDKKTADKDGSPKKAYGSLVEEILPRDVREPQYYASLNIPNADTILHFTANTAIRLPPNLSILATMNTSDQNVFTLDNAFQRRFDMQLVRNEFEKGEDSNQFGGYKDADIQTQHDAPIAGTSVKWGDFWEWINKKIVTTLKGLSSTEDKRLGVWFVSNVDGEIDGKIFAEKVLKYLWDDAFKFKRPQVFAPEIDTLERLIAAFEKPVEGKKRFDVFKDVSDLKSSVVAPPQNNDTANQ